jgi:type I restriction-modification system DNA methylase subunit
MPPTASLSPEYPEEWYLVEGHKKMIEENQQISPERKDYLLQRLPLWDDWAERERARDRSLMAASRGR